MRLKGKVAIVTGAASGFGAGIARRFAEEGAQVVVNDLSPQGENIASEIGGRFVQGDVTRGADWARWPSRPSRPALTTTPTWISCSASPIRSPWPWKMPWPSMRSRHSERS